MGGSERVDMKADDEARYFPIQMRRISKDFQILPFTFTLSKIMENMMKIVKIADETENQDEKKSWKFC